jgi:hypothetical protein
LSNRDVTRQPKGLSANKAEARILNIWLLLRVYHAHTKQELSDVMMTQDKAKKSMKAKKVFAERVK